MRRAKIGLDKIHLLYLELPAVQVVENTSVCLKIKQQLVGIQCLIGPIITFVQLAVLAVAQQGMAGCCHLRADLMGPAGDQFAFHQAQTISGLQRLVFCDAGFGALLALLCDIDPIFDGVLEEVTAQGALGGLGCAMDDTKIALVQLPVLDFLIEDPQTLSIFCCNDDTAGVAVNPVAQGGGEAVFFSGTPFPFGIEVGLDMVALGLLSLPKLMLWVLIVSMI